MESMHTIDLEIEVFEIYDRTKDNVRIIHIWPKAGDQKVELWMSDDGLHHAIYTPDSYYNEKLQKRRNLNNMICSQDKSKRLVFIANLSGTIDMNPDDYFEILRSRVTIKNVVENEY